MSCSGGSSLRQRAMTCAQRVWKRQPGGGFNALGTSPCTTMRLRCRSTTGSATGTADSKAWVYGCSGARYRSSRAAISTMRPRYITATRWLK